MAKAPGLPLLSQYSDVFTRLHDGRLECIRYGMDRVALNRFIVDSAANTSPGDFSGLLSMVDPEKIGGQGTVDQQLAQCEEKLRELVSLQEEVNTLQKVAREKGITGGFLNIVGQAALQSPKDHGASVIHQLSDLMGGTEIVGGASATVSVSTTDPVAIDAANDEGDADPKNSSTPGHIKNLLKNHWRAIGVDVLVCFVASVFAIRLVS